VASARLWGYAAEWGWAVGVGRGGGARNRDGWWSGGRGYRRGRADDTQSVPIGPGRGV